MGCCVSAEKEEVNARKGGKVAVQDIPRPPQQKKRSPGGHGSAKKHSGNLADISRKNSGSGNSGNSDAQGRGISGGSQSDRSSVVEADLFALENYGPVVPPAKRFKLRDLEIATSNWDESAVLGEGSFGKVYRGVLEEVQASGSMSKIELAVKKLSPKSFQGYGEWLAEVMFLDKLRHPNLVRLVGFCQEDGEALLAYELCPKGSLDRVFFSDREEVTFSWEQRLKIALDAAQGLVYLHENNVIHRDFKPSNILLGSDNTARLTDFGMAKEGPDGGSTHISTRVMGTLGYLDPAYMQTGRLTHKSDTYSYGVMLLELISGKKAEENLTRWARPLLAQRRLDIQQLVDPKLGGRYSRPAALKIAILAKHCLDDEPVSRPEMNVLVKGLQRILRE